ncbi:transcriptional regulator [archaeon]|nr:transcriptional regulator [archaeon]
MQKQRAQATPQEIEVWYILPAVRKGLARELVRIGTKQKEIALILGITEPAVSQYLSKKRGAVAKFSKGLNEKIKAFARKIIKGKNAKVECLRAIQEICEAIRKEGCLCRIHKKMGALKTCKICK